MSDLEHVTLQADEWTVIRDFVEDDCGNVQPKYEAKFVESVSKEFIDDNIVLVKETLPFSTDGRMYHLPKDVLTQLADRVP
ncbi:hypothetical protein [Halomontanus rarus]|uniref:hypothetical protein n=1 Tax=Halomontanus rarus TaxID=3034020 RepID=UPI0023E83F9A|nr:hypothetical protein [Halovivax sp. TS33]